MGFGHYTAYAKNPLDDAWYEFDDSQVSKVHQSRLKESVVTNAAYNLFYRRRDWHQQIMNEGIDYEKIAIQPNMDLINGK